MRIVTFPLVLDEKSSPPEAINPGILCPRNPHLSGDFEVIVKATPEAMAEMVAEWGEKVQAEDLDAQALPPTREVAGLTFWAKNGVTAPLHQAPHASEKFAALLLAEAEKLEALAAAYRQRAEAMQGQGEEALESN